MVIVTSLSCNHHNAEQQALALDTWQLLGDSYSLNTQHEIDQLQPLYKGIKFIITDKTVKDYCGKNLISINAIFDFAKEKNEDLLLINSDILIDNLPSLKTDGIIMFSRHDYADHFGDGKMFGFGFDAYYIPKRFLNIFPPFVYGLGNCWWDLSLGYRAILKGIPLYWQHDKFIFHKQHPIQYNYDDWLKTFEFFRWEFDLPKNITAPQAATDIMAKIKSKAIIY